MVTFVSLNGPDGTGKTTQLGLLARRGLVNLGSVHEHLVEPWAAVAGPDYATWWFERVPIAELCELFRRSYEARALAGRDGCANLLDRGHAMLTAVVAATACVRSGLAVPEAVSQVTPMLGHPRSEIAILLLNSRDRAKSMDVSSARDTEPWSARYENYQRYLFDALLLLEAHGRFDMTVVAQGAPPAEIHGRIWHELARRVSLPNGVDGCGQPRQYLESNFLSARAEEL